MTYGIVKSLHIISIVAWMAGMLYLPRLFVYHSLSAVGSDARATFEVMERRLLKAIMLPAMIGSEHVDTVGVQHRFNLRISGSKDLRI